MFGSLIRLCPELDISWITLYPIPEYFPDGPGVTLSVTAEASQQVSERIKV